MVQRNSNVFKQCGFRGFHKAINAAISTFLSIKICAYNLLFTVSKLNIRITYQISYSCIERLGDVATHLELVFENLNVQIHFEAAIKWKTTMRLWVLCPLLRKNICTWQLLTSIFTLPHKRRLWIRWSSWPSDTSVTFGSKVIFPWSRRALAAVAQKIV